MSFWPQTVGFFCSAALPSSPPQDAGVAQGWREHTCAAGTLAHQPPSKPHMALPLSGGSPGNHNVMPDSCPGSQKLIPGWKCKHFPHGEELFLADYKWERLAAINTDGYSLKNDFKVLLINCPSQWRMEPCSLGISTCIYKYMLYRTDRKNEPDLWHYDELFRVNKAILASILDLRFTNSFKKWLLLAVLCFCYFMF